MNAAEPRIISQLATLTGLDHGSVKQQLLPYINSQSTASEIKDHLQGLLGDSSSSAALIREIISSRGLGLPSTSTKPSSSGSSHFPSALSSRSAMPVVAGINDKPAPRKVKGAKKKNIGLAVPREVTGSPCGTDSLAVAFGSSGSIYRKDKGFDDLELQYAAKPKALASAPAASCSVGATPAQSRGHSRQGSDSDDPSVRPPEVTSMAAVPSQEKVYTKEPEPQKEKVAPTAEMLQLDYLISQLTATTTSTTAAFKGKRRICFCGGRQHVPDPNVPLCPSCHLIICSQTIPSPIHATASSCPSCSRSPLLDDAAQARLLAQLTAQYERLEDAERERVRLLRLERERARTAKAADRERGAGLFPELVSITSTEAAKRAQAQHALGRGGAVPGGAAEKSHKVFSLDFKTHKVTEQRAKPQGTVGGKAAATSGKTQAKASGSAIEVEDDGEAASDVTEIIAADETDNGWAKHATPRVLRRLPADNPAFGGILHERPWANWTLGEVQMEGLRYIPPTERHWTLPMWSSRAQSLQAGEQGTPADLRQDEEAQNGAPAGGSAGVARRVVPGAARPEVTSKKGKSRRGKTKGKEKASDEDKSVP
ncbi:hypothetical protein K437DRAFT_268613 [Tilletiaria anomala UBC 951]|uniref:TRIP4/RQT4 C2HC5-type zinc finger domain-containing protein n=1 Tax=Tilletiaria anomala (strain ATCC 24038 / CBS 436.72 / UBC 951) TaxID=1037660 RepID=A0A066VTV9_TILAU|nr:uncharacterized protein K437DRAFT_268613 [Tilletiaria anomala UBC 951]KDN44881.1 hypothetical protein K437DRAFT_268613 [Tilletiaria anomala UBC 951]